MSLMRPTVTERRRKRTGGTLAVWLVSSVNLLAAGLIAAEFVFMATSLDPTEILTVGTEPWTDALLAAAAFAGLVVATVLSLGLWHRGRLRTLALLLTAAETGAVVWACVKVYNEYL